MHLEACSIKLRSPIQAHGETIDKIALPRPKVKHFKVLDQAKGEIEGLILLISALAEIPTSSVEQMDAQDFQEASKFLNGFFSSAGAKPTAS